MYQVDEDERRKMLASFGKTEETATKDVITVRKWLQEQKHIPEIMGNTETLNFLQLNKFDISKTKDKIEAYYTVRSKHPDFLGGSNPKRPQMQRVFDNSYFFNHPKPLDGTSRILWAKPKERNNYMPLESMLQLVNLFEVRLHEDCMVSDTFILDMEHMTFRDMLRMTPRMIYKMFLVYRNVWALRMHATYLINAPSYVSVWISIFKLLVKQKLIDRIQVHRGAEVLKQVFAEEDLPEDYGGSGLSLTEYTEMTKRKLEEYQDRFDKLDKMTVKAELIPEK